MAETALDFLLENMIQLINCNNELILKVYEDKLIEKDQIKWLYSEFQFLRMFLYESEESCNELEKVNNLVTRIRDVTSEAEDIIDTSIVDAVMQKERSTAEELKDVTSEKEDISILNFSPKQLSLSSWLRKFLHGSSRKMRNIMVGIKSFVGKKNCLARGSTKKMNVIGEHDSKKLENVAEESDKSIMVWASEKIQNTAEKTHHSLDNVIEEIKSIKIEVLQIYDRKMYGIKVPQIRKSSHGASPRASNPVLEGEFIAGFDDDTKTIMELLTEEHEKHLKIIPIIGMPGLGKTTLARKVYNDPFIAYYFYIRAWTYVSQVYQKRDLLLSILSSARIQLTGEINEMNDEKLGEELYKRLKGNKYLIVIDDIWNIGDWDNLKRYFPNDYNGSRIIFTSRLVDVAVSLNVKPHFLRFLNEDESWELLEHKAFHRQNCPPELMEIGKIIAEKCQGLPLAIVVVSGLLAKEEKTQEWWSHVAESVSSYIVSEPEKYMDTLALSYNHLPHHLKPCFLYLGTFPEGYEIPVWQLIWLWVAEGFIRQNVQKSLEEVAEDYLIDLIDRSLVVVSKKRSNGGIKACQVHDLLHDLCLRKAQEENFLQQILKFGQTSYSSSNPFALKQRCMSIHDNLVDYTYLKHYESHIRSFLSFGHSLYNLPEKDVSFVCQAFKLLRVLILLSIKILFFPKEIEQLVHLRYLALHVEHEHEHFQPSISNLRNLETLHVDGPKGSLLLYDIWKMEKLRHVSTRRLIEIQYPPNDGNYSELDNLQTIHYSLNDGYPSILDNLQTIGKLNILVNGDEYVLKRLPNLKKLKCQCYHFPRLEFLNHLETLNLVYDGYEKFSHLGNFPINLKSLTLSNFRLPWKAMSTLGSLPNLKVLKLSYKAFEGPRWDTSDGGFRELTFLRLQGLDIVRWNASSNHFANLQTLVLDDCERLEEIPPSLGDISTLLMIQVRWCSYSVENSARQIQEQQYILGNDGFKVLIYTLYER